MPAISGATNASIPSPGTAKPAENSIRRSQAYCSANDRTVPVLVQIKPRSDARRKTSYREAEQLRCLDYGVRCTGYLCPLFDVEPLNETGFREHPQQRMS